MVILSKEESYQGNRIVKCYKIFSWGFCVDSNFQWKKHTNSSLSGCSTGAHISWWNKKQEYSVAFPRAVFLKHTLDTCTVVLKHLASWVGLLCLCIWRGDSSTVASLVVLVHLRGKWLLVWSVHCSCQSRALFPSSCCNWGLRPFDVSNSRNQRNVCL